MKKLKKYQSGGNYQEGMMKAKMATADAMGNPDAHRMMQNYPQQYIFNGNEQIPGNFEHPPAEAIGSHFMGSYGNYAIPSIQQSGDTLRFNPNPRPSDRGAIRFNNENDAEYFGEHYKEVAPMMRNWQHQRGGQVKIDYMKLKRMQKGGAADGHAGQFWDGEKWISSSDGATYSNGTFFANGGNYGNPVFPVQGAGAMFANGGRVASFYVDGNGRPAPFAMAPGSGQGSGYLQDLPTHMNYGGQIPGAQLVNPFAMNPGPGTGSGYLQDLPTEMKKGGHTGHGKKLSPQQIQMMQAMAQQQMQGQQSPLGIGAPMGNPGQPMMAPPQMGEMAPQGQMMPPQQAHGGIHIKKANVGKFTAYKQRTGKTTEEALHSKDPHVRQMANFARNAKKWHHEMGGIANPLAKFMADGGMTDPWESSIPSPDLVPAQPMPQAPQMTNPDPNTDARNQKYTNSSIPGVSPQYPTGDAPQDTSGFNDSYSNQQAAGTPQAPQQRRGYDWLGVGLGALGAGIGVASALEDRHDQRNLRNKQFNDRSTVNQYSAMNQPGGMGNYDQYGSFRPNSNTPTRAGYFPPQQGPIGQYGGQFAMGGNYSAQGGLYQPGSEHDMSDEEIMRLRSMGYKIDLI